MMNKNKPSRVTTFTKLLYEPQLSERKYLCKTAEKDSKLSRDMLLPIVKEGFVVVYQYIPRSTSKFTYATLGIQDLVFVIPT